MRADADFFCLPIEKIRSDRSEVYIMNSTFIYFDHLLLF